MTDNKAVRARKTGILVVNLGTPEAPTAAACKAYLKEFLSDTRVVELPRLLWWPILNLIILQVRPKKSAETYAAIWTEEGSPLMAFSRRLVAAMDEGMGSRAKVELAMRYGSPSMADKLEKFRQQGIEHLIVLPLYPQYAAATTASIFDRLFQVLGKWRRMPAVTMINEYYDHPAWARTVAASIAEQRKNVEPAQLLLFSFHGLPDKSRELGDPYHDQCQASARMIADELGLQEGQWRVVFQSRFGKAKWLQPYCVDTLRELPAEGITSIDVVCPGFAVDCLETLEEINITNREIFMQAGGKEYRYLSALNDTPAHAEMLQDLLRENM